MNWVKLHIEENKDGKLIAFASLPFDKKTLILINKILEGSLEETKPSVKEKKLR